MCHNSPVKHCCAKKCFLIEAYISNVRGWREKMFNIIHRRCLCVGPMRWWNAVIFEPSKSRVWKFCFGTWRCLSGFSRLSHENVSKNKRRKSFRKTSRSQRKSLVYCVPIFVVIHSSSDVKKDLNHIISFQLVSCMRIKRIITFLFVIFIILFTVKQQKIIFQNSLHDNVTQLHAGASSVWNQDIIIFCVRLKQQSDNHENRLIFWCASGWIMSLYDFHQGEERVVDVFHRISSDVCIKSFWA